MSTHPAEVLAAITNAVRRDQSDPLPVPVSLMLHAYPDGPALVLQFDLDEAEAVDRWVALTGLPEAVAEPGREYLFYTSTAWGALWAGCSGIRLFCPLAPDPAPELVAAGANGGVA